MNIVEFEYRNHRGEVRLRRIEFECIEFLRAPGYGYQPGWFLSGYDIERKEYRARRSFALSSIVLPSNAPALVYRLFKI